MDRGGWWATYSLWGHKELDTSLDHYSAELENLFLGAFLSATKRPRFKAAAVLTKYSLLMGKATDVGPPDTL